MSAISTSIASGYRELATTKDAYGIVTDVLMVRSDTLRERPDDVNGVLKALFKALEFRETNELAAYTTMSEAFKMPVGELRETIGGNIFPDLKGNRKAFEDTGESTSLFSSGRFISDFFVKKGIVHQPIDLDALLEPDTLKCWEPWAGTGWRVAIAKQRRFVPPHPSKTPSLKTLGRAKHPMGVKKTTSSVVGFSNTSVTSNVSPGETVEVLISTDTRT